MRLAYCAALPLLLAAIHDYNTARPTALSVRLNNHDCNATRYDELNMILTSLKELLDLVVELHLHPAPHLAHRQLSRPPYVWAHLPRYESCQQHFKLQASTTLTIPQRNDHDAATTMQRLRCDSTTTTTMRCNRDATQQL